MYFVTQKITHKIKEQIKYLKSFKGTIIQDARYCYRNYVQRNWTLHDDTLELLLEPSDGVVLCDSVLHSDLSGAVLSPRNAVTRADKNNVEVHAEYTSGGIIFQAEIDVLVNSKAEAAGGREVGLLQLVLLHLQATVQNLLGLSASHLNR